MFDPAEFNTRFPACRYRYQVREIKVRLINYNLRLVMKKIIPVCHG